MKKLISLLLAAAMILTVLAGCNAGTAGGNDTTTEATVNIASAVEILENIWANYGDAEKFPIIGGNMEAQIMDKPANYDMAYAENLPYNLLIPAELLSNVDEAASMIHMMNANTFTAGVVHLTEGTDVNAFASSMRDAIQGNMWMCGFPETLVIASFGGGYVLISFGVNDAMNPFQTHLGTAYADAEILYNEAITG